MSIYFEFKIYIYQLRFSLCQIFSSNLSQLNVYIIYHHINSKLDHNYFNSFSVILSITNLTYYTLDSIYHERSYEHLIRNYNAELCK